MLTKIDGSLLVEAFPSKHLPDSLAGSQAAANLLNARQWTERFVVKVEGESVLLPARLNFTSEVLSSLGQSKGPWGFARALQTRSTDGFLRQRAARDLLDNLEPWGAPFIIALTGEYVVQILDDIAAALTPANLQTLGGFIAENEAYWRTTKRRVMSYWNVYYRSDLASGSRPRWAQDFRPLFSKAEYPGFSLTERLEAAAFGRGQAVSL